MKLFSRNYGSGKALIILHGLYGSSDNWVGLAKVLSKDFHVIIPDLRNHGKSPHDELHSYPAMLDDILELYEEYSLESAHILGHSMGGKLAMFFATEYPEKIKKLIVADMTPRTFSFENDSVGNASFHMSLMSTLLRADIQNMSSFAEADEKLNEDIAEDRLRGFLLKNIEKTDDGLKWKLNLSALKSNMSNIMQGLNVEDFRSEKLKMPALFLRGEKSDYISIEDFKIIREIFPYSEIISIPKAGHWLHAEQPKLFIKNVQYFLNSEL